MEAASLIPHEQVHIFNLTNGERLITYVIKGEKNSNKICVNGPAAKKIVNALNKKKKMFIFPWQWHIVIKLKRIVAVMMANTARKMQKKRRMQKAK